MCHVNSQISGLGNGAAVSCRLAICGKMVSSWGEIALLVISYHLCIRNGWLRPVAGADLLCEKSTTDSWWLMLIRYEIKDTAGWLADKPTEQSKNRVNFSSISAEI